MAGIGLRRWVRSKGDRGVNRELAGALGIHPVTAGILVSRGFSSVEAARAFLNPSPSDLLDPFRLEGMDRAVARIREAVRRSERVVVYGDYDVDGITATALFLKLFKNQGLEAGFFIPDRQRDGYGLNTRAIEALAGAGTRLLITADCGTTSVEEIGLARSMGMDVIVTDHHEVSDLLPPAVAVLNPKRPDSGYADKGLCTAGLAFKVGQALSGRWSPEGLDLVALGTIADVSPLLGENRFLVKEGLLQLSEGGRVGIQALKEAAGLKSPTVGPGTVGFTLGPRINAAGRLGDASEALRLLTTESPEEARGIAEALNVQNRRRQEVEEGIVSEAVGRLEAESAGERAGAIVLASPNWHLGVVGIVAARLAERYYRPAIVLSVGSDGLARGSARSIPGFNVVEALKRCGDLLLRFGGHRAAAGLTLQADRIPEFRDRLSAAVLEHLGPEDLRPRLRIDAVVRGGDLTQALLDDLARLSPFGPGNPEPVLLLRRADLSGARVVGNNHLKLTVRPASDGGGFSLDAIGFGLGERLADAGRGGKMDLAFTPEKNTWQGRERIQLRLKDLRACVPDELPAEA